MYTDRQPNTLFNLDGDATRMTQWIVQGSNGPFVPIFMSDRPMLEISDPFGFTTAPMFQVTAAQSQGRQPDYENALIGYQPIDLAHLVRYTKAAMTLVWLGNDALAKDDLRMQAEIFRFSYHWMPNDSTGYLQTTGLADAQVEVAANPGEGFNFGRREGWGLNVSNAAYALADDNWRAESRPWYGMVMDLVDDGQMTCTGIIQNQPFPHLFDAQYRCRQEIEAAILENALMGMRETVFAGNDPERVAQCDEVLIDTLYSRVNAPVWNPAYGGPEAMMATAPANVNQPPYCTYVPADGSYGFRNTSLQWSSLAYGYELTGDELFLNRAAQSLGGNNIAPLITNAAMEDINNRAPLLALIQAIQP